MKNYKLNQLQSYLEQQQRQIKNIKYELSTNLQIRLNY